MPKINGPFHSLFYPDYNGDRVYSDEDFGLPFKLDHSNGVYLNQSTQALQIAAAGDMNLTIRAGYCFIEGHFGGTPLDGSIVLDNAHGTYPRIDRIVMRHYGAGGELDERKLAPLVLTGTPAQNPKAPDIVRNGTYYDLSLATVLVPAGAIEITAAHITDTRFDTSVCGAVTGKNENPLDTTELFAQFTARFDQLMDQIRDTLGEDAATNLLNLYNRHTERMTDFEGKTNNRLTVVENKFNTPSQINAGKLQGKPVNLSGLSSGKVLIYNGSEFRPYLTSRPIFSGTVVKSSGRMDWEATYDIAFQMPLSNFYSAMYTPFDVCFYIGNMNDSDYRATEITPFTYMDNVYKWIPIELPLIVNTSRSFPFSNARSSFTITVRNQGLHCEFTYMGERTRFFAFSRSIQNGTGAISMDEVRNYTVQIMGL